MLLGFVSVASASPLDSNFIVHPAVGQRDTDVIHAIRREFSDAALVKRGRDWKNSTTISRSWNNVPLLQLDVGNVSVSAGVEIICTECYLKAIATGELSITDNNFNLSQTISNLTEQFKDNVENLTTAAEDWVKQYVENIEDDLSDFDFGLDDIALPTFDFDLNLDIPPVPQANLHLKFDGLELYMLIDTILSLGATYKIPLFNSAVDTPEALIGFEISDVLEIGLIFKIDLILQAQGTIDISSGFHLLLNDGFAVDIALFDNDVSHVTNNGGHFEFLPVQIESAGVVFSAILQVSVHAGIDLVTPDFPDFSIDNHTFPSFGGGMEVGVFANVAEFITNVTAEPDSPDCELQLAQSYVFALGASAGATINIASDTWGPAPTTSTAIYTTAVSTCAAQGTSTASPQPTSEVQKRQDLSTATIFTTKTYTGVNCFSTGLVDCPASLQNTSRSTTISSTTTLVPSGTDIDDLQWPVAYFPNAVTSTATFGKNAISVPSTAGTPVAYTASPTSESGVGSTPGGEVGSALEEKVDRMPKKTILGVSVGLGIPIVIASIVVTMYVLSWNRLKSVLLTPCRRLVKKRRLGKQRASAVPQYDIEDEVQYEFVETKRRGESPNARLMGESRYLGRGIEGEL
ncbi:hypothetical protein K431DRAFT_331883 [Polychaeton citri CBS 116435]|uniref:Mid2 domain-containing protein n=1 Tax=Polychaeton citri CBS 116435 TaxID=1314669 RepID=A0A9P4Q610_9PEZI|nr:hypothetical protein K431DRAFT_331883 [Polychaeton citri CBS 116435]